MLRIILSGFLMLALIGCGGEEKPASPATTTTGTTTPTGNVAPSLYGKWIYIDTAQPFEIDSTTTLDYSVASENILKVGTSHLLRASVANTHVEGTVLGTQTSTVSANIIGPRLSALSGIGGINVILENTKDPKIKAEVTTDQDGNFNDDSLPSGLYSVEGTADDGTSFSAAARLEGNRTNLGNFQLSDANGYNFKAELIMDKEFIYGDENNYTGVIRIYNIGSKEGVGLFYDVNVTDYYLKNFTKGNIVSTIEPGQTSEIPISFNFNPLSVPKRSISVKIKIGDAFFNTWEDTFTFDVYRRSMNINLISDSSSIKGYVVMEGNKLIPFDTNKSTITLPIDPTSTYHVMLSNSYLISETKYSIGFNTDTIAYDSAISTDYEPNNDESNAKVIGLNQAIKAYLYKGDLDYYTIDQSTEFDILKASVVTPVTDLNLTTGNHGAILDVAAFILDDANTSIISTAGTLYRNGTAVTSGTAFNASDTFSIAFDTTSCGTTYSSLVSVGGQDINYSVKSRPCEVTFGSTSMAILANETATLALSVEENIPLELNSNTSKSFTTYETNIISFNPTYADVGVYDKAFTLQSTEGRTITPNSLPVTILKSTISDDNITAGSAITMKFATNGDENNATGQKMLTDTTKAVTSLSPIYTGRYARTSEVIDGKIYVLGGYNGSALSHVEVYDPSTDTWTTLAPMNTARYHHTSEVIDGKIYVIGGYNTTNLALRSSEVYDPETNAWTTLVSMSTKRYFHLSEVFDGKIYVMGGYDNNYALSSVEIYDPVTNKWTSGASMNWKRYDMTSEILDGKIYTIGGYGGISTGSYYGMEVYDPKANTWTIAAPMSSARRRPVSVVNNGKIYVMGGYVSSALISAESYDPKNNIWTTLAPMSVARDYHKMGVINNKIYVLGGQSGSTTSPSYLSSIEVYDPDANLWATLSSMNTTRTQYSSHIIQNTIYAIAGLGSSGTLNSVESYDPFTYIPITATKKSQGLYETLFSDLNSSIDGIGYTLDDKLIESHFITVE